MGNGADDSYFDWIPQVFLTMLSCGGSLMIQSWKDLWRIPEESMIIGWERKERKKKF